MSAIVDDATKDAALRKWIEDETGAAITRVERVSGGAYRTSARVTLDGPPGCIFLKIDLGSAPHTPFDLRREYEVLARLDGRAYAPRAIGWHEGATAMAMHCLPGEAVYTRIDNADQRARIDRSFTHALADCHKVDLATLGLDHLAPGLSIREAIVRDIDLWERLLREGVADPDPLTLFAFQWLRDHLPHDGRPAVLVQGDAGAGNFLFDRQGVTGVVDWEMAHLGHPLEDLGCILARSLVQPMADAETLLAIYREASGVDWTRDELVYATILVMTRFSVPIALALESRHTGIDFGLMNSYFRLSQISLIALIAQAEGVALDQSTPATGPRPAIGFELDYLRDVLATIVQPAIEEDYVRYRLDGAIGLIGYLRAAQGSDEPAGDRIIPEGERKAMLQHLMTGALWREELMRGMLGPLHGRRVRL